MMTTKEKILLTSYKLFINNGFHNTSMQQLVDESQISKGAFYHHFKNKSDLYEQVINEYFSSFYNSIDWSQYEEITLSIEQIEKQIQQFYLNFIPEILAITENGMSAYYIMYFEAYNSLPKFKITVQNFYHNLEKTIIKASDNKTNSKAMATKIIAKYEGLIFLLAIKPELKINELLKLISV